MENNKIRVLQLIDSLAIGGAERMSVNLANALAEEGVESFLCATRRGGALKPMIAPAVRTCILHKRSSLDPKALYRLIRFIRKNGITVIHAHSSSFLTAILVKPFTGAKVVWHDHNGERSNKSKMNRVLILVSFFFDGVISVNEKLAQWSRNNLHLPEEKVIYLPNFATLTPQNHALNLPGDKESRIVCLANLREQKDHMTLLKAFKTAWEKEPTWHLLLVGDDREDAYSRDLKAYIVHNGLEKYVHILGSRNDSADILLASTIGVLSSLSEGLPVALLEYGLAGLPVVTTAVGQCPEVLQEGRYGKVVPPQDPEALSTALLELMRQEKSRELLGKAFQRHMMDRYSQKSVVSRVMTLYRRIVDA